MLETQQNCTTIIFFSEILKTQKPVRLNVGAKKQFRLQNLKAKKNNCAARKQIWWSEDSNNKPQAKKGPTQPIEPVLT